MILAPPLFPDYIVSGPERISSEGQAQDVSGPIREDRMLLVGVYDLAECLQDPLQLLPGEAEGGQLELAGQTGLDSRYSPIL